MSKNKRIVAEKLLKKEKIQQILQYWNKKPKEWFRPSELINKFAVGPKLIRRINEETKEITYWDPIANRTYTEDEKPKTIYSKESAFYRDLSEMVQAGLLENKKISQEKGKYKSCYRIGDNYKFEPFKILQKNNIKNCPANNIYPFFESTLYHHEIPYNYLDKNEQSMLDNILCDLLPSFHTINSIYKKIGLRRANIIWKKGLPKLEISHECKFYVWLRLIALHYLASIEDDEKKECYRNGIIPSIQKDILIIMKARKFIPPFPLCGGKKWQEQLIQTIDAAFQRYLSRININYSFETIKSEFEEKQHLIQKLFYDTISARISSEDFSIILSNLTTELYKVMTSGAYLSSKEKAEGYETRYQRNVKPTQINEVAKLNFFEENRFFEGFIDELLPIKIDNEKMDEEFIEKEREDFELELCLDLRYYSDAFKMPELI